VDKIIYRILVALAILGLAVSIYMTVFKLTSNENMCLGSGDCSTVNNSRYASVYGIPVAAIGVAGYLAILATLLLEGRNEFLRQNASMILFGLALAGFLFTVYLIYVEIALIHALCPFCITSQVAMTAIFMLSIIRLVRPSEH
jgi:uncharacterized membrane protein